VLCATLCSVFVLIIHDSFGGFISGFVTLSLVLDGIRKVTVEAAVIPVSSMAWGLFLATRLRVESADQDPNRT